MKGNGQRRVWASDVALGFFLRSFRFSARLRLTDSKLSNQKFVNDAPSRKADVSLLIPEELWRDRDVRFGGQL